MNIQEKLRAWADAAYDFYSKEAYTLDLDFYTQSDLTLLTDDKPVELMVIGINPGHGGNYQEERFAKPEDLLRGNCDFKKEGNPHLNIFEWHIVRRLRSILGYGKIGDLLNDESRFVLTNATFFSTPKETGLNDLKVKAAQKVSIEYTKKLIDIIRPKHIICLGGKNCMNLLLDSTTRLLGDVVKLDYGVIDGIPVYGIEHTSSFWAREQMELVGKALERAFEQDHVPIDYGEFYNQSKDIIESFIKKRNDRDEIEHETALRWEYIYASLSNYCKYNLGLEVFEESKDRTSFYIPDEEGKSDIIISLVNQKGDKSVGVRYSIKNHVKDIIFDAASKKLTEIDKSFKPMLNTNGNVIWIGKLGLTNRLKDTDTFIRETKELIWKVVEELQNII